MQWVLDHGADHGLDPKRILIVGESGGGGLAAALTQRLHDEGVPMAGQLLACPMLDDRTAARTDIGRKEHLGWSNGSNHFGWSCYLGTEPGGDTTPEYAVPARRSDLAGLRPAWIGVGDLDVFWDEDIEYGPEPRRSRRLGDPGDRRGRSPRIPGERSGGWDLQTVQRIGSRLRQGKAGRLTRNSHADTS